MDRTKVYSTSLAPQTLDSPKILHFASPNASSSGWTDLERLRLLGSPRTLLAEQQDSPRCIALSSRPRESPAVVPQAALWQSGNRTHLSFDGILPSGVETFRSREEKGSLCCAVQQKRTPWPWKPKFGHVF